MNAPGIQNRDTRGQKYRNTGHFPKATQHVARNEDPAITRLCCRPFRGKVITLYLEERKESMKRKTFISSAAALLAFSGSSFSRSSGRGAGEEAIPQIPGYLDKGDWLGITAPAGHITPEEIQPAVEQIRNWGFNIRVGATVGLQDFTFAGTDEERLNDVQRMLDDPSLKAILFARGGYGAVRIIDRLHWEGFKKYPKWIIGFSDATVFHAHINRNLGIASLHSKMTNSFPDEWEQAEPEQKETILSIQRALRGEQMSYTCAAHPMNRAGTSRGVLIGGNLKTLESLSGTASDIQTAGKLLFVEDTGEYLYSIDRMFWNLKRTGKLDQLKGLIIGGFRIRPDDPGDEFGKNLYQIVMEKVQEYGYPVCFDFPVGHQKNNYALKCGVLHRLQVDQQGSSLTEIR